MIQSKVRKIRKRDGRVVDFEPEKIRIAILKALTAVGREEGEISENLTKQVVEIVEQRFREETFPTVEDVQDIVEGVLIENRYADVAKAYILYRQRRSEIRDAKRIIGVADDLKLSVSAVRVLRNRYLLRDGMGHIVETPTQMFRRVATPVAAVDKIYREEADLEGTAGW